MWLLHLIPSIFTQTTHEQIQPGHVLRIVASVFLLSETAPTADDRQLLTWEHVYGADRVVIRDPAPREFVWLDDTTLLLQKKSWERIEVITGQGAPFYDASRLREHLSESGVSEAEATEIADGNWTLLDAKQFLCILRTEDRLVRAGLDGKRIAVVEELPQDADLLTLSPSGNVCAFVANNNLWCADFEIGQVRQLTHETRDLVRTGLADWLYFEEILRRKWKAFRFSPDGQLLVFQQFDDTSVPSFSIVDHSQPDQTIEVHQFPRAGESNPAVRLGVVAVDGGPITWVSTPHDDETTLITHFGWYPDSRHIYWYAQNRSQTWLDVIHSSAESGDSRVVLRETTDGWVDQPGDLRILQNGDFLWLSERSGWKHVEHVTADGQTRRPVTHGPWDVSRIHAVNEDTNTVVVTGTRDSPIADNIYRVSMESGAVSRLSWEPGHHVATVCEAGNFLVDRWNSHRTRTSVTVRAAEGRFARLIHPATLPVEWDQFEFGEVSFRDVPLADGQSCQALFVFPPGFDESRSHPVWLKVYGAPRYPRIKDVWNARLADHLLATHGVVVIRFDPRTSGGHGATAAWKAHRRLGVEETRDVEAVCAWLSQQSWADADRIGMSGHSYGGYLTSYVMTHSDCLTAGIAGSPVTDWANYDTIYTERYMGTPQDNPEGYHESSVVAAASNLHGRLLLVHGLRDDNVHPANTFQLVRALQQSGQDFDLMVYPRARHAIHDRHYSMLRYNFILDSLEIVVE